MMSVYDMKMCSNHFRVIDNRSGNFVTGELDFESAQEFCILCRENVADTYELGYSEVLHTFSVYYAPKDCEKVWCEVY